VRAAIEIIEHVLLHVKHSGLIRFSQYSPPPRRFLNALIRPFPSTPELAGANDACGNIEAAIALQWSALAVRFIPFLYEDNIGTRVPVGALGVKDLSVVSRPGLNFFVRFEQTLASRLSKS